jgi:SPP1 gp7 family putative phage head morphogenesis protein
MAKKIKKYTSPKKTEKPAVVVQELNVVAPNRNRKDAGLLKQSIQRAESITSPNRAALYDIYYDVVSLDGHLSGILNKRTDSVLNKNLRFIGKDRKKVDIYDDIINSEKFNDLIRLILDSKYWGRSGVEFIIGKNFDFEEIPRKHINLEKDFIVKSQYDQTGIPISELPFCWTIGKKNDLGQLLQCSLYSIYKRGALGDFAQYVEIFGQPVRIIYYDAYDTKTKGELRQLLDESGSSLALMIPKQAQFQMLDGKTSNGNGELQSKLITICNQEMSIAILGNSETTTSSNSSGYAQSSIHARQQLEITKNDLVFVQNTLNDPKFKAILKSYGYPIEGSFEYEIEIDLEALKQRLEIDKVVSEKIQIDDDYWYDTYGYPRPDLKDTQGKKGKQEKETKDKAEDTTTKDTENEETEPDKKTKKNKEPEKEKLFTITRQEKGILQKLSDFFFGSRKEINLSDYYRNPCCAHTMVFEDLTDDWDKLYEDIARQMLGGKVKEGDIHPDLYFSTAKRLMKGINQNLGDTPAENKLKAGLLKNVYQFSAAKNLTELLTFREAMLDPDTGEILPFSKFKARITDLGFTFNETWLQTEYDTAVSAALMARNWDMMYEDDDLLEFTTVGDERVRESHKKLNGLTYPKKHPIWNKLYPPLDFNCRCHVIPGAEHNYKPENAERDEKYIGTMVKGTIFDQNVGKTQLVFSREHPYYENLSDKKMKQLGWQNYGLKPTEQMQLQKGMPEVKLLKDKQGFENFWKEQINDPKGIKVTDTLGLDVLFPDYELIKKGKRRNHFKQHISERTDDPDRYKLMSEALSVIYNPSEIWSVANEIKPDIPPTFHYVKFYDDRTLVVLVVNNEARTIFELNKVGFRTRHGILLYRK